MTTITTGTGLGLFNTSLDLLGRAAPALDPQTGRPGQADRVYINSQTGNLIIQQQDEYLASVGIDLGLVRTYNAQGKLDDDNADNWRLNVHQRLYGLTGTVNTAGSTITKVYGDAAEALFTYDTVRGLYVSTAGDGAHDTLSYNSGTAQWTFTDGTPNALETYNSAGQLLSTRDADGNTTSYTYTGSLITRIDTASGETVYLDYTGNNLTQIRTVTSFGTETRVRYGYDALNRLTTVTVDLTPEDNSIADGKTYVTAYTYDGTSNRIASITNGDGVTVAFTYVQTTDGLWRVASVTDGVEAVTRFDYGDVATANADTGVLSTTETQASSVYNLNSSALQTTQTVTQNVVFALNNAQLESRLTEQSNAMLGASLDTTVQIAFDPTGNAAAVWSEYDRTTLVTSIYANYYTVGTGWQAQPTLLETGTNTVGYPQIAIDSAGNAIAVWQQYNGSIPSIYASRYTVGAGWQPQPTLLETGAGSAIYPKIAIDSFGNALVAWNQYDGTAYSVYASRYTVGAGWQAQATLIETGPGPIYNPPLITIDPAGNAVAIWQQSDGSTNSIYANYYTVGTGWQAQPALLETGTNTAGYPQIAIDSAGNAVAIWQQSDGSTNSIYANYYTVGTGWQAQATLLETGVGFAGVQQVVIDSTGNAIAVWQQYDGTISNIYANRYTAGAGWQAQATLLETGTGSAYGPRIAMDSVGNALVVWQQNEGTTSNIYAKRYTAGAGWQAQAALLEAGTGYASNPSVSFDTSGNAIAVWYQYDGVYANYYTAGTGWQVQATRLEAVTDYGVSPRVTFDGEGNAVVAWEQHNGQVEVDWGVFIDFYSAHVAHYRPSPVYTIQVNDTWASIAQTLYGSTTLADTLQSALGSPSLTAGQLLVNLPESLASTVTSEVSVAPYYTVPSGATWSSIATTLYGTGNVADELQAYYAALGITTLTAGSQLIDVPATLTDVVIGQITVDPYYTVLSTDTWVSITQTIYGTGAPEVVAALQAVLGNPALTTGLHLTMPLTLNYYTGLVSGRTVTTLSATGAATVYVSDMANRLTRTTDALGATTNYAYDADGNLTSVTDALGHITTQTYDSAGNLTLIRDAAGNNVTYTYDTNNRLVTETRYLVPDPDGAGSLQPGTPVTTRFAYDSEGHLRFTVSAEGRVTENRYNTPGLRVSTITYTAAAYDLTGLTSTTTLSESSLETWVTNYSDKTQTERVDYAYDFRGKLATVTSYAAVMSDGSGNTATQSVTSFIYDARGNLLQTVDARGTQTADASDYVTAYTYDGLGRLLTTNQWIDATHTHTRTTVTSYDDAHNKIVTTLANGLVATSTFDAAGHLVSVVQGSTTVTLGTTTYQYDAAGNLRITTDPTGLKTQALYDADGRLIATVDALGNMAEIQYDALGHAIKTTRYATPLNAAQRASLVDASGKPTNVTIGSIRPPSKPAIDRFTYTLYDKAGRAVITLTPTDADPAQAYVTQYFYDGANRLIDTVQYATAVSLANLPAHPIPDDVQPLITLSKDAANDRHSRSFYDNDGNLTASLDAEGYLREYRYNAAGALIETSSSASAVAVFNGDGSLNVTATQTLRATGDLAPLKSNITAQGQNLNDQHSYVFYNSKSEQIASLDAEGYLTEYQYDTAGNKTVVTRYYAKANAYTGTQTVTALRPTNLSARVTVTAYDGANQVTSVTTQPDNVQTTYAYDAIGHLISTTSAAGTNEARTQQARYDIQGRITQELTAEGSAALAALVNPTQAQIDALWTSYGLTHTYDAAGRRTSTTDANGNKTFFYYDAANRLTYTVNALGEVSQSVYNALGEVTDTYRYSKRISTTGLTGGIQTADLATRVAAIASPTGTNADAHQHINYTLRAAVRQAIDALGNTTNYSYNAFGNLITKDTAKDASTWVLSSYAYDHRGLLTNGYEDTAGLNRHTSAQYDAFGRIKTTIDGNGNQKTYSYDRLGRTVTTTAAYGTGLAATITQSYDAFGRTLTQTDALGNLTTFIYTDAVTGTAGHHCLTVTTPEGISTTTETNAFGETVTITDGNGHTSVNSYDKNGRQTGTTDALNHSTQHLYDKAGLERLSIDANGHVTRFIYDAANRLITRSVDPQSYVDATGNAVNNASGLNLTTSYAYDGQGRVLTVIDANGIGTQTQYDMKGQVTSVTVDPQSYMDSSGNIVSKPTGLNLTTAYTYDAQGHTLTVTEGVGTPEARTTQYVYDNLGRRTQQIKDPGGLNLVTAYVYDNNDNVVQKTEGQGTAEARTIRYVYDVRNRLTDSVDALGGVTHNDYDANGNIVKTTDYANVVSLIGLTNTITASDLAGRITLNSASDRITQYAYDKNNRLVYTRDSLNQLTQRSYDKNNNVTLVVAYATAIPALTVNTKAAYDAAVATAGFANATLDHTQRTVYDAAGRAHYNINSLGYVTERQYDALGNLTDTIAYYDAILITSLTSNSREIDIQNLLAARNAGLPQTAKDQRTQYQYDAAGRIVVASYAVGTADQYSESFAYDKLGQEIRHTDGRGNSEYFAYDATGNRTRYIGKLGYVIDTAYNSFGQVRAQTTYMNAVALPSVADDRYAYDAPNPAPNSDLISGDRVIAYAYDLAGRIKTKTVASLNGQPGVVTHYLYNAIGSTTDTIEAEGLPEQRITHSVYDQMGRLIEQTTAFGAPEAATTRFTYDALGNQKTYLDPRGVELAETGTAWAQAERLRLGYSTTDAVTGALRPKLASELSLADKNQLKALYTTNQAFDRLGRKTAVTDALNNTTQTQYDAFGNIVKVTDPKGSVGYFYFDALNRVSFQVDPEGYASQTVFDANGNAVETVKYANKVQGSYTETSHIPIDTTAPASGPYLLIDAAHDQHTYADYDALDRAVRITDAENHFETFQYDAGSNVTQKTDKNGNVFRYDYDARGNKIAEYPPAVSSALNWYGAQVIETGAGTAFAPQIATDAQGNVMAVWGQNQGTTNSIYANRFNASTGTWGTAQLIETGAGSASSPQIAVDAQGNALAVWVQNDGTVNSVYANRYNATTGTWGTAQLIETGAGDAFVFPQIAIDAQGNAMAVWGQNDGTAYSVYANRYNVSTGTWGTAQLIEAGAGNCLWPQIAIDAQGNAMAVWGQYNNATYPVIAIYANRYNATTGTWGTAQLIETGANDAYSPQIAIDAQGNALAVWYQKEGDGTIIASTSIYANRYNVSTGTWGTAQLLETGVGEANVPQIAVDAQGNAMVVWAQKTGAGTVYNYDLYANRYNASTGTWGTAQLIQTGVWFSGSSQIAFDTQGNARVVWLLNDGGISVYTNRYTASTGTWGTAQLLETGAGAAASAPQIGIDAHGKVMVVWSQNDGTTNSIYANRYADNARVINRFEYDAAGNLKKKTEAAGLAEERVTRYVYDKNDRLVETIEPQVLTSSGLQTPHTYKSYDTVGNLITETDAEGYIKGNITHHYYDAANHRIATVDAERYLHVFTYDAAGNRISERVYADKIPVGVSLTTLPDISTLTGFHPTDYRETTHRYNAENHVIEQGTRAVLVYDRTSTGIDVDNPAQPPSNLRHQTLVTTYTYDHNGNVAMVTDARGAKTYMYYDRAGNKALQVDALGYVTTWAYDANGNVLTERRYATALNASVLSNMSTASNPAVPASNAEDRITTYTYDRMNRVKTETLANLGYTTINATTGAATEQTANEVTEYEYDAMGNRTALTAAKGTAESSRTDYSYDALNQLIREQGAAFTDYEGTQVRTTTEIKYDGVGNVITVINKGKTANQDQLTHYAYDAHGNVIKQTDAEGNPILYFYDLNSNVKKKTTQHTDADSIRHTKDSTYDYNALNQQTATVDESGVNHTAIYNAYGEITDKGVGNQPNLERFEYDYAGRLIKTNKDDGIWRVYLYDANGNQTAQIQSAEKNLDGSDASPTGGIDFRDMSLEYIAGINAGIVQRTESEYDARNQLINTYQAPIDNLNESLQTPQAMWVDAANDPFLGGTITAAPGGTFDYAVYTPPAFTGVLLDGSTYVYFFESHLYASWSPITGYGDGGIRLEYAHTVNGQVYSESFFYDSNSTGTVYGVLSFNNWGRIIYSGTLSVTNTLKLYKATPSGEVLISEYVSVGLPGSPALPGTQWSGTILRNSTLQFTGQQSAAQRMDLTLTRISDGTITTYSNVPKQVNSAGVPIDGWFVFDWSSVPAGDYNYEFVTKDAANTELERVRGNLTLGTNPTINSKEVYTTSYNRSGSGAIVNTIARSQTWNAFGEIASEIDSRGNAAIAGATQQQRDALRAQYTTNFNYNTRGQLVAKIDPEADATDNYGVVNRVRPVTHYYYNQLGQVVGERTLNSNYSATNQVYDYNTQRLDSAGHLLASYNGGFLNGAGGVVVTDMGIKKYQYDIFGNAHYVYDELDNNYSVNYRTTYSYNKKNQLVRVDRPTVSGFYNTDANGNIVGGLTTSSNGSVISSSNHAARYDIYSYDEMGNRISQTNALGEIEKTYYDDIGRVTKTISFGGTATNYQYVFDATTGNTSIITTNGDGKSLNDTKNYFGQLLQHLDLGSRLFTYTYNLAGWLTQQTGDTNLSVVGNEQNIKFNYYHNGFLREIDDTGVHTKTRYEYDANGNRTLEAYYQEGGVYYQWSKVEYDELNRIKKITDPSYGIDYEYDAAGNRRHVYANYHDGVTGAVSKQDYWYTYDAQNRFNITKGNLAYSDTIDGRVWARGTNAIDATTGYAITYNADGSRKTATYNNNTTVENYTYADGMLLSVISGGVELAKREYDAVGNVLRYTEYDASHTATRTQTTRYFDNAKVHYYDGKTYWDQLITMGTNASTNTSTYTYNLDGSLQQIQNVQSVSGQSDTTVYTKYTYEYWDSAKQSGITNHASNPDVKGTWKPGFSQFEYDVNGHLTKVSDAASNTKRYLRYKLDSDGRILQRNELVGAASSRTQNYYYVNGQGVGDAGSFAPSGSKLDYASLLAGRNVKHDAQGARPVSSADFDYNFQPINDQYPATTPGSFTVPATMYLEDVARAVWGDSTLWYVIADANGFTGNAQVNAGNVLVIPNVVTNIHNSSSTFKVYNPGELIGDTSPTLPDPLAAPRDSKACAAVIVIIVAFVVTILTDGATAPYFESLFTGLGASAEVAGTAAVVADAGISAAAGSAASQVVAMKLGLQDKFDWGAVGIAALTAGITKGILPGDSTAFTKALTQNLVGQGVNMLAGRQEKFNWSSLAVTAIAAPINSEIDQSSAGVTNSTSTIGATWDGFGIDLATGLAKGMVTQGVSLLVNRGGTIQWANIAGEALGGALGNALGAEALQSSRIAKRDAQIAGFGRMGFGYDVNPNGSVSRNYRDYTPVAYVNTGNQGNVAPITTAEAYFLSTEPATAYAAPNEESIVGTPLASIHNGRQTSMTLDGLMGSDPFNSRIAQYGEAKAPPGLWDSTKGILGAWLDDRISFNDAARMALDSTRYYHGNEIRATGQMVTGAAEVSAAFLLADTGVGAPFAALVGTHGVDNLAAGYSAWANGDPQNTQTYNAVDSVLGPKIAHAVDEGISLLSGAGVLGAVRAGAGVVANTAARAEAAQISSGYKADVWSSQILSQGDIMIGMRGAEPNIGQSAFYTNVDALRASNMNFKTMGELTQVAPNPRFGLRQEFGVYEVQSSSVEAATGRALANAYAPNGTFIGNGGATQYFIPTYKTDLQYLYKIRVLND